MSTIVQSNLFDEESIEHSRPRPNPLDGWCHERLGPPTSIQKSAWPVIREGGHALLLSATGQGKSLAGWLPLVERHFASGAKTGQLQALHIARV